MYDKSKKTWSQRLKITKSEKSATAATASITTTTTTTTTTAAATTAQQQQQQLLQYQHQQQQHLLAKANNAGFINRSPQAAPTTPTVAAMHLPTAATTLNEFHGSSGYDFSPSALSRSMKYAEPWIYGTVRGMPNGTRPYHYQPNTAMQHGGYMVQHPGFFAHPMATSELAIVICSCPEYLNGTKRDMKKASVCKKCKGSRLPLAPIGGTVRLRPNSTPLTLKARSSGAATMRIVTTNKKSRPTILDPQQDPYDLMRRSRLLSPEPSIPSKLVASPSSGSKSSDKSRSRGKSESPSRGRSRTRPNLPQPQPTSKTKKMDLKIPHSASNNTASFSDCWLVEEPPALSIAHGAKTSNGTSTSAARRSILRCNVNPYDLISSKSATTSTSSSSASASNSTTPTTTAAATTTASMPNTPSPRSSHKMRSQNEFMAAPKQDEFDVADAKLYDEAPPFLTRGHSHSKSLSESESKKNKPSGNINHGRATQQQLNEKNVKNSNENVADDDYVDDNDHDNDALTQNKSIKKNYTNVKAIAGQRISLGETNRTTKKSLIKQSEDGRIYESIIIAGDEDECQDNNDDDNVVQKTIDVGVDNIKANINKRRHSAESVPKLKLDLEQPKRPPRNSSRKSESGDEATTSTTTKTTKAAANHSKQQQMHVATLSKDLPNIAANTPPAIKSILKRPTSLLTEHDGAMTATTNISSDNPANSSQDNSNKNATRHERRQQARASKKELIEHFNSSSTTITTPNSMPPAAAAAAITTPTTAPIATATFYIPLPQARKKVQFMVEDRIIQPDDNVDNSDTDNNDNETNIVVVIAAAADEDEVEFDEEVTRTATKSLNYEYYERKREQLKAQQQLTQQQQQLNTKTAANPCGQPPAGKCNNFAAAATNSNSMSGLLEPQQLNDDDDDDDNKVVSTTTTVATTTTTTTTVAKTPATTTTTTATTTATNQHAATVAATLEHESNLVSSTLSAIDAGNNNHINTNNNNNNNNNKNSKNKSTNKNKSNTACSITPADNNVLQHVAANVPAHSSSNSNSSNSTTNATNYEVAAVGKDIIKDTATIDAKLNILPPTFMQQQTQSDDFDDGDVVKEEQAKPMPPQQEQHQLLPAFVAAETRLPLSRNPIRRSHSERQPAYNKLTNGCKNDKTSNNQTMAKKSNNNNAAIFNFKDTMALRMKNVRSDSRDLFASNSMATAMTLLSSVRPKEPPPPPPPTFSSLITATAITATASTTAKVCTKETLSSSSSSSSPSTTLRRSSLSSLSLESISAETLSPEGHKHEQQQQAIKAEDKDATARNAKLSTNGLENHSEKRPQQPATPRQVVVITATGAATAAGTDSVTQPNNENQSSNSNNNGASCHAINRPTSSTDNSEDVEAPSTRTHSNSSHSNDNTKSTDQTTTTKMIGHTTIPTSPRRNKSHNNNYGLFVKSSSTTSPRPERTVVRVAPLNKISSEIHRLKINHTDADLSVTGNNNNNSDYNYDNDYFWRHSPSSPAYGDLSDLELSPFQSQKKTSILINGDDCYSTMNLSHDASTPLYQSSVVVADYSATLGAPLTPNAIALQQTQQFTQFEGLRISATTNTVTINVSSSPRRSAEEELIYQNNQINSFLSRHAASGGGSSSSRLGAGTAIIPINGSNGSTESVSLQRSASSTSSASATSISSGTSSSSNNGNTNTNTKRGRTLVKLDYDKERQQQLEPVVTSTEPNQANSITATSTATSLFSDTTNELFSHEAELVKILRNPVEAVRRNLVPHVCGRNEPKQVDNQRSKKMTSSNDSSPNIKELSKETSTKNLLSLPKSRERNSFIAKLLEDPMLNQVAEGLESETIVQLIENSLKRLKESRSAIDTSGTKDNDDMMRLIDMSLQKLKEERQQSTPQVTTPTLTSATTLALPPKDDGDGRSSNRGSISSVTSFSSANNYEMFEFDTKSESDCYQSCSSEITSPGDDDGNDTAANKRSKFYQMLVDATLAEIEISTGLEDTDVEHHYESIRQSGDPIYEEISDMPPPLPLSAPPMNDADLDKKAARSMFEGASKYEILSYLVDAKQRGLVREEPAFEYPVNCSNPIIIEEEAIDTLSDLCKSKQKGEARDNSSSRASIMSDSSEDNQSTMSSLSPPPAHSFLGGANGLLYRSKANAAEIERNDSGVGSETSKSSRSKYQHPLTATTTSMLLHKNSPIHLCEDCDGPVETQITDSGVMFAPLVCRKCGKKRAERKEIITEIVETEEKYGRDLQIVLEEFCQPMLVAGLLTQEQLSAIFLNTEDLLENNQTLAERMRDALDIALEQGDDDMLTVNIGRIFLDFTQMLHAFESYCVRQAGASLLLANLEKEKELLRIFLKVSQMENTVLRRMNLNSFLMVPVQRVTKYPLLLARLYKVTPAHLEGRDLLKQAQEKIELHLNHINQEAKDVPTKLWRRISSSSPNRRASCEIDMINIKLRKMAIDVLEWNHDEVRFAMEGKLLFTQPTDSNWKKARTIKLTPVNALLVTNGKPSGNYKAEKVMSDKLNFPKHTGVREASLLLVKEKCGRYTLIREPLYLDRCVVCSEADWDDYFEVQEISSKDTFIFKAEDGVRTKQWYTQLQYHAQGMGAWRKRRNALANIMINGMLARS